MITWDELVIALAREAAGTVIHVPAHRVEHPRDGGLVATFGAPNGQRASYRAPLSDGSVLCVDDFGEHYEARVERPVPTIRRDRPRDARSGLANLGALVGLALGRSGDAALAGAIVGSAAELAARTRPPSSRAPRSTRSLFESLAANVNGRAPDALPSARREIVVPVEERARRD